MGFESLEKDIKYLEFLFVYYIDDPIRKDHDWELFDRLSPRKRRNIINLNSGQLFEILEKLNLINSTYKTLEQLEIYKNETIHFEQQRAINQVQQRVFQQALQGAH
jgi:hypothetical protein